jgi:hypothetical protein
MSTLKDNERQTLDHPSLNAQWNIRPAVWLWKEWREVLTRFVISPL